MNLASIHYHFGDKAELYREVFRLPFLNDCNEFATLDIAQIPLQTALHAFYNWLFPVDAEEDPMMQLFLRLHSREEAEPSGVLGDVLMLAFKPNHEQMQRLLCREFGLKKADAEVDRLTFCLAGLASVYFHGGRGAVEEFAPHLVKGRKARETMVTRLVEYAEALVEAEKKLRLASAKTKK